MLNNMQNATAKKSKWKNIDDEQNGNVCWWILELSVTNKSYADWLQQVTEPGADPGFFLGGVSGQSDSMNGHTGNKLQSNWWTYPPISCGYHIGKEFLLDKYNGCTCQE